MSTVADRFRRHAEQLSGLYAVLLREMASDWEAGGVVRDICRGWERADADALIQLRLLAGLHRIVLTGQAPQLVRYYPNLGGSADPVSAWPAVRAVLVEHAAELRESLHVAPQTNEPGRSVALLVGLFEAVRRSGLSRVRLLEPGASAGLNLLVDRFRISATDPRPWRFGPVSSALAIEDAVIGAVQPVPFEIVERRGCDLAPVDPLSPDGQLRLVSFVWPHQLERHARLRAAFQVAAELPPVVDRAPAARWLSEQLHRGADPAVLTVVWHSVTRLYWPAEEVRGVAAAIAAAAERYPVAEVAMESPADRTDPRAELSVGFGRPGSPFTTRRVGAVADHGVPVRTEGISTED